MQKTREQESGRRFGTELITLPEIFQDHFFVVPDYQRSYAWSEKQVNDLLQDIDHLMRDPSGVRHYTGTVVLSRPEGEPDTFHVVDGQQRLTTLVIFMSELAKRWAESRSRILERFVSRGTLGNERLVLTLNQDTHDFYERYVIGDRSLDDSDITISAHKRLLEARKRIAAWLARKAADAESARRVYQTVSEQLGFIVYAPAETSETGIMFEVINNRGKDLSELEKVKNYLIYCCVKLGAKTLRNDIDCSWSIILRNLNRSEKSSPDEESAFLRYCLVVHYKASKQDSQHGYETIKKRLALGHRLGDREDGEVLIKEIKGFIDFLEKSSRWYLKLHGRDHARLDGEVARQLDRIRAQARQASIMPIFIALAIKLGDNQERLARLLGLVEKLNFRVYLARDITNRNDSGQAYLYQCASSYYHDELIDSFADEERKLGRKRIDTEEDALEYRLLEFSLENSPDQRLEDSLFLSQDDSFDFFHWGGLRYFLMSYEEFLQKNKTTNINRILAKRKDGLSGDYFSIEHLWARRNRVNDRENNRYQDWYQRRRLGNFVLLELRLNIQGQNHGVEEKLAHYLSDDTQEPPTELLHVRKAAKDAKKVLEENKDKKRTKNYYYNIHDAINNAQEERYRKFALRRWSLKGYLGHHQIVRELSMEEA